MTPRTGPVGALAALLVLAPGARAQDGAGTEDAVRILHADRAPLDRSQTRIVLEGHVRLARGDATLSGEHLTWDREARTLEMRGDVVIKDRASRLSCEHLLYDLREDAVTAWGMPRLEQGEAGSEDGQVVLTAIQLRLFPKEGRVEAIEDVLVEQVTQGEGGSPYLEMQVRCRVAEVLARGKRNIFKGQVRVETPDIGARAGRVLYEQESRRVYLLDGARVWNYDSEGKRLDELTGDKIVYFLDEARTIALGGVRAVVHPEDTPSSRSLTRTRRLPVE